MKKILIVEDELAYVKILLDLLTDKGYKVITAKNGKEGLAMVIKEDPDLILLDIKMPVMDGMTMLDLLRKEESGNNKKVIMLTNIEPNDKILRQVVADQPAFYFVKSDIQLSDLFEKIRELLAD